MCVAVYVATSDTRVCDCVCVLVAVCLPRLCTRVSVHDSVCCCAAVYPCAKDIARSQLDEGQPQSCGHARKLGSAARGAGPPANAPPGERGAAIPAAQAVHAAVLLHECSALQSAAAPPRVLLVRQRRVRQARPRPGRELDLRCWR